MELLQKIFLFLSILSLCLCFVLKSVFKWHIKNSGFLLGLGLVLLGLSFIIEMKLREQNNKQNYRYFTTLKAAVVSLICGLIIIIVSFI